MLLEVDGSAGDPMDVAVARSILDAIADADPSGLHSPDRVAFQAWVGAMTASEALESATARWAAAARRFGVRGWHVVRGEVLAPEEFERDCDEADMPVESSTPLRRSDARAPDAHEEELLRRAFHDSLTQLADQELFRSEVEHAVVRNRPSDSVVAVLYFDLDEFRWVNRSLGARVGDDVLVAVARRIVSRIRPGDKAARMGGDRFAVLVENTSRTAASLVAERILEAIRAPHDVDGREIVVTASLGMAFSPPADRGDDLIRNAEAAMRSAKQLGTGRPGVFDADAGHPTGRELAEPGRRPEMIAYLGLLERAAKLANECETVEEAAGTLLEQICTHTGWAIGQLHVRDLENPDLTTPVLRTVGREREQGIGDRTATSALAGNRGLRAQVVATRQPAWSLDVSHDGDSGRAGADAVAIRSSFAAPVLVGHEVVAVLELLNDREVDPDPSLVEVVTSIGIQLGRIVERRRARASLAASEARLRALVEASGDMMAVVDTNGDVVYQYERAGALHSPNGEPAERLLDLIHPEDRPTASAYLSPTHAPPGVSPAFRCRVLHVDGSWKWMEFVTNSPLDDPAVGGIVVRGTYVAGPDEPTQPLHEGHRLATWRFDLATGRREWSPKLYDILGLSSDDADADLDVLLGLTHPEDRPKVVEAIERVTASEDPVSIEFRVVRTDGSVRWVQGAASRVLDRSGEVVARHGILVDITDRKEEEEALAAIERTWRELLKDSTEALTLLAQDGAVLFSLAPEGGPFAPAPQWGDAVTLADLVHPDDHGRVASLLAEVVVSPEPVGPVELRVRCADGSWRRVESVAKNLLDAPLVGAIALSSRTVATCREEQLAQDAFADRIDVAAGGPVVGDDLLPRGRMFAHR
ncbi:MAG TPA: diguanylate cyclase [Acidimicrobiales bacterium]|nr:diguanylate cyclase [Acidimicrobiales bacterium]